MVNSFLLHVFDLDAATYVAVIYGKSFVLGVFVGLGPFRLVALLLWRRNASLAGGFAGRPGVVCLLCYLCYDLPFDGISQLCCLPLFHCLCRY